MLNLVIRTAAMVLVVTSTLITSPTISKSSDKFASQNEETPANQNLSKLVFEAKIKSKEDDRAKILAKFLRTQSSPMAGSAEKLVEIADKYNLDWRLLPAIAGVESQYGRVTPYGSYNPYGWNNGKAYFTDWTHATDSVASGIRIRYASEGEVTPYRIGPSYAENPLWASQVINYMYQIDQI